MTYKPSQDLETLVESYLSLRLDHWKTIGKSSSQNQVLNHFLASNILKMAPLASYHPLLYRQSRKPSPALSLHLSLLLGQWNIARQILPFFVSVHGKLDPSTELIRCDIQAVGFQSFCQALDRHITQKTHDLIQGVYDYLAHPYQRPISSLPILWERGKALLYDYGSSRPDAPILLVIPSLINRPYILDFKENRSLLRFLSTQGIRPLLLDWGIPSEEEKNYGLEDYWQNILLPAYEAVRDFGQDIFVTGYCMGGMLAIALAHHHPEIKKVALMATPWDFSHHHPVPMAFLDHIRTSSIVAPEDLQVLFYGIDPLRILRKFQKFRSTNLEAETFVALEDWANDGVALSPKVASECFEAWFRDNKPYKGKWKLGGVPIEPAQVHQPTFMMSGKYDRIVPAASAQALASQVPDAIFNLYDYGHTGLMIHASAEKTVWIPLAKWLKD